MSIPPPGSIDCDIHPVLVSTKALLPYMSEHWQSETVNRGIDGLDLASFPLSVPANLRPDFADARQGSLANLQTQLLDRLQTRFAICNCLYGSQVLPSSDMAVEFCRAQNSWLAAEWLDRDPRLRGSIVVSVQEPELAVREIERLAPDSRFVQILLIGLHETPYGRRQFWPIYEAAEKHDLPICIHAGSSYSFPPSSVGWPSFYVEEYFLNSLGLQTQLLSFLYEGVFVKFPRLKLVLAEAGFTWLPNFLWRINKTWMAFRSEVPWLTRPPAEIVRENVRFTLQPSDAPPRPDMMMKTMDQLQSDEIILFSTDYPHWHHDGENCIPDGFSPELIQRITTDNPLATYPRLKEASS